MNVYKIKIIAEDSFRRREILVIVLDVVLLTSGLMKSFNTLKKL